MGREDLSLIQEPKGHKAARVGTDSALSDAGLKGGDLSIREPLAFVAGQRGIDQDLVPRNLVALYGWFSTLPDIAPLCQNVPGVAHEPGYLGGRRGCLWQ
jgi:hypothetical protein